MPRFTSDAVWIFWPRPQEDAHSESRRVESSSLAARNRNSSKSISVPREIESGLSRTAQGQTDSISPFLSSSRDRPLETGCHEGVCVRVLYVLYSQLGALGGFVRVSQAALERGARLEDLLVIRNQACTCVGTDKPS